MTRLVLANIKNIDQLLNTLIEKGYKIEEGPHTVLLDNSEVEEIHLVRDNELKAIMILHYISQYYKAVIDSENKGEEELLEALIKAKYMDKKWRIPVNPVAVLTDDNELIEFLDNYRDEYPIEEAEKYLEIYRKRNPDSKNVYSGLLARILERLSSK